jgi:uncharacterized protein DUF6062
MCHGAHRAAWRYLDALLWESVNDPGIRGQLRAAHGFCKEHWSMALDVASAQSAASGIGILAADLLQHVLLDAAGAVAGSGAGRRRRQPAIAPEAPCPACVTAERTAAAYLEILAVAEDGSAPWEAVRQHGRRICVPHLAMGFRMHPGAVARRRLMDLFRRGVDELRRELHEFGRKHDYRYRHEGFTRAEATSWRRGVACLAGERLPSKEPAR